MTYALRIVPTRVTVSFSATAALRFSSRCSLCSANADLTGTASASARVLPAHAIVVRDVLFPVAPCMVSISEPSFPPHCVLPSNLRRPFHSAFIGLVYPSYRAYRTLKYDHGPNAQLEVLTTFLLCVFLTTACTIVLDPLFGAWLPLYHPAKLGLLAYLASPQTNGASVLFASRIEPVLRQMQDEVRKHTGAARQAPTTSSRQEQ